MNVSITKRPKENVVSPRSNRRYIVVAAIALCAAIGASFLLENRGRQAFFGQSIRPPQNAFDFHLTNQQGNGIRLNQWRPGHTLFLWVHPLSQCLPNYFDESGYHLPCLIPGRSPTSANCFHQRGHPPGHTGRAAKLSSIF